MTKTELYRSATLLVRHVPTDDITRLVVTFDNLQADVSLDRAGFGEAYLAVQGVAAIHVLGVGNDWYQYPDLADALAAVRAVSADVPCVLAYGSSMGGYAAIRHADAIGATAVLALSPQYAIDQAAAPFERRWTEHASRIRWLPGATGTITSAVSPVIVYDPTGDDARHAALIEQDVPVVALPLPHVGHPATTFLANTGLLGPLMFSTLDGSLDRQAFIALAAERRRHSSAYFVLLAERAVELRPKMAAALAESALAIEPDLVTALVVHGRALSALGRHAEALAELERAIALSDRLLEVEIVWLELLVHAGQVRRSLAETDRLIAAAPHRGHLPGWKAHLHWMLGEEDAAFAAIHAALAIDPTSHHHATSLAYYQAEQAKRDAKWRWYGGGPARRRWQPLVRWIRRRGRKT